MSTEDELPHNAAVFRVLEVKPAFFPKGRPRRPLPDGFNLSSEDKRHAAAQGVDPRLSVWDCARTTAAQAKGFRRRAGPIDDDAILAYRLRVADILAAAEKHLPTKSVRVIRDPLEEPQASMPGGDGHCGIVGTHRPPGQSGKPFSAFRLALADACGEPE